jgi:hypothetical protein
MQSSNTKAIIDNLYNEVDSFKERRHDEHYHSQILGSVLSINIDDVSDSTLLNGLYKRIPSEWDDVKDVIYNMRQYISNPTKKTGEIISYNSIFGGYTSSSDSESSSSDSESSSSESESEDTESESSSSDSESEDTDESVPIKNIDVKPNSYEKSRSRNMKEILHSVFAPKMTPCIQPIAEKVKPDLKEFLSNIESYTLREIEDILQKYPEDYDNTYAKLILSFYLPYHNCKLFDSYNASRVAFGMLFSVPKRRLELCCNYYNINGSDTNMCVIVNRHMKVYETPQYNRNELLKDMYIHASTESMNYDTTLASYIIYNVDYQYLIENNVPIKKEHKALFDLMLKPKQIS